MAKDVRRLALAGLLGAAIAFPAGMMFAGRDDGDIIATMVSPGRSASGTRNIYSPNVISDPYVLDQQRKLAEALEMQCRRLGERCGEAEQARRWIDDASR